MKIRNNYKKFIKRYYSKKSNNYKAGFTLVELLLYISLSAIVLLSISFFLTILIQSRVKNQVMAEVDQQGIYVMRLITQTIRNAKEINSPVRGMSAASLSLGVDDVVKNPTIFDINSGIIRIIEGTDLPIDLTSDRIIASNLFFLNLSRIDTSGNIRIQFDLTHVNPANRQEYNYNKTFYGSANIRK